MSSVNYDEIPLSGNVITIPLVIEDEDSHEVLKETKLFIHICKAEYQPSDDPTFINISLTGIHQDGSYHGTITKDSCGYIFRSTNSTNDIEAEDQPKVIGQLFPIDEGLFFEESDERGLRLSARQALPLSQFDIQTQEMIETDDEPKDDSVVISIKTGSKIPITVGSIKLEPVDFEEQEALKDEGSLFNWLELLQVQNMTMAKEIRDLKASLESSKSENAQIATAYDVSKEEHKMIIDDLEQRFFQLLNSKKDKIWSLIEEKVPKGRIEGLNQKYVDSETKLNVINKNDIADELDAKYVGPKRKTAKGKAKMPSRKRRKIVEERDETDVDEKSPESNEPPVSDNETPVSDNDTPVSDVTPISDDDEEVNSQNDLDKDPEIKLEDSVVVGDGMDYKSKTNSASDIHIKSEDDSTDLKRLPHSPDTKSGLAHGTDYSSEPDTKPPVSQNDAETDYGSSEDD